MTEQVVTGSDGVRGVYSINLDASEMAGLEFCAARYTSGEALRDALLEAWSNDRCIVDGEPVSDDRELTEGGTFYLAEYEAWAILECIRGDGDTNQGVDDGTIPCFGSMDKVNVLLDEIV